MKNNAKTVGAGLASAQSQDNNGITLIALVVTIIVLLILAGVTLSLVAGGNGIIGKAEKALTETQKAALKEQTEMALTELQMEYYLDYDGSKTFEEFIKEKCGTEGFETSNGGRFYVDDEGKLVYENDDGAVLIGDENGTLVPDEVISNTGEDTTAPQISTLTTTNSITIVLKDRASGVTAYAITESETEPSDWTSVSKTKRLEETITGKTKGTQYYVWAKDASGNVSHKPAKTLDFEAFASTVSWEENMAVITVTSPTTGVQFNTGAGWQAYSESNKPRVASGTTVQFQITDGTNTQACASVQPLKKSTVRYNLNGGTGTLPANVEKTHNDRVVVDTTVTLTKTGYTFLGWARESNATGGITEFTMPGEDVTLYAVWQDVFIGPDNYGDIANYSANGVDDWKVFLNDGTYIYLIASDYVPVSGLNRASGINTSGSYCVYASSNRDQLLTWLQTNSYWSKYAEGFSGATATGGPTLSQFWASYNGKYGTSYSAEYQYLLSHAGYNDTLYFPHKADWNNCYGYWLASPSSGYTGSVENVYYNGDVYSNGYSCTLVGVRPLVQLPAGVKAKFENGKWTFAN